MEIEEGEIVVVVGSSGSWQVDVCANLNAGGPTSGGLLMGESTDSHVNLRCVASEYWHGLSAI